MSLKQLHKRVLLLLLFAFVVPVSVADAADCGDIFDCTLDVRWPIDLTLNPREQYTRLIIVRKRPAQSVDPEAYLVMRVSADGAVAADYTTPKGESLYSQIREHDAAGKTPADIGGRLSTTSIHLANSAALRKLARDYQRVRIPPATPEAIYLDATRYEMVDVTIMNRLVLRIFDSPVLPQNDLLTWAKRTLTFCERAASKTQKSTTH